LSYQPLYIKGFETGLVQDREEFILPNDAFPILENAFVWRERIKRKQGCKLLGRLERQLTSLSLGNTVALQTTYTFANIFASFVPPIGAAEPNKEIIPGSVVITIGVPDTATFTDDGQGGFIVTGAGVSLGSNINYATGAVTIVLTVSVGGAAITANISYYPNLPVMGLNSRELTNINTKELIVFDQIYAYHFVGSTFQEWIPGTTWSGNDSDFFWSTNYWVDSLNSKIFWVTNFSGITGDPIRYTNGTTWIDFAPQINAAGDTLNQCLVLLPYRGRLLAFNTFEGPNLATSIQYPQRIRWAAIGNPFSAVSAIVTTVNANAWRDDIRGQGGFLDIPTSEDIVAVGFVRDNLVIYCETSTWQLRYTGRTIAPFQIEKINSELGAESTFSAVQFDTSLVGIGDKGVVECDSFKSERIDIKIPDLVFFFNNDGDGQKRVHGIRDFQQRLAYWTYPYKPAQEPTDVYPNRRLVYNYENDSWAIFTDSYTTLGTFQAQNGLRWQDFTLVNEDIWQNCNFPWINRPSLFPSIVGGNQQGFVEYLDIQVNNQVSLTILGITGFGASQPTQITSPSHNLETGQVIEIENILASDPFFSLNGMIFSVVRIDNDHIALYTYNTVNGQFNIPRNDASATYLGSGEMSIRDNFSITSKKFNFFDDGQMIQLGYLDVLMDTTTDGAITLNVYVEYNDDAPANIIPQNQNPVTQQPDLFFNSTVPTTISGGINRSKTWQRVICPTRSSTLTLEWTLSNAQMVGEEQESNVQIDAQILWMRPAGKQLPTGF